MMIREDRYVPAGSLRMKGSMNKNRLTIREIAYLGICLAILEVSKLALDFLPNVELVTLLFIVYTIFFGKKTLFVAAGFIVIECLLKGINVWSLMYLYIWPALILMVYFANKLKAGHMFYCLLSGFYGLFFGLFCFIPYLITGGLHTAIAWWISGIPYDIIHCISNFLICLFLFRPLCAVMKKTVVS